MNRFDTRAVILQHKSVISGKVLDLHTENSPGLLNKLTESYRFYYLQDTEYHIIYLAEAIAFNQPGIFESYVRWARTFLESIRIDIPECIENFYYLKQAVNEYLSDDLRDEVSALIDSGIEIFSSGTPPPESALTVSGEFITHAQNYLDLLLEGDRKTASDFILRCHSEGISVKQIYSNIFIPVQKEAGRLWHTGKIDVAQEHFITASTQFCMSRLYSYMFEGAGGKDKILVSCINGELHEMGPRMVSDFFEMDGWDSHYLGANTPAAGIISYMANYDIRLLALSVTMPFNLSNAASLIKELRKHDVSGTKKVIVGGYAFYDNPGLWQKIGADGYAPDMDTALTLAESLLA